jgi:RNA polymerase sigma-70 factor (sigma-E family)
MLRWGAPESFDEYVRNRHSELLRFAHVLSGDPHLAADLVQDALERTGLRWGRLRNQDDPEAYVRRVIVNGFVSNWRRLRREYVVSDLPEHPGPATEPPDDEVERLLAMLPRQQRVVLVLRFYGDMTEAAIAELLGCSVGTVKSNSSRAIAKLRTALTPSTVEGSR